MVHVDRLLYWFLTRTSVEKLAVLGSILGIIVVIGFILLSMLASLLSSASVGLLPQGFVDYLFATMLLAKSGGALI